MGKLIYGMIMLTPAERLAFVLHDLFAMPFDEIGSIVVVRLITVSVPAGFIH